MQTPWRPRTEPVMNGQSQEERWGPEFYVHLEFRVGWTRKPQPPKTHQVTYRSRYARERSPQFPRQVPAPNTNYLAAIHNFEQTQSRMRQMRQRFMSAQQNRPNHQMQEYYQDQPQHQQPHGYLQVPAIQEPERPTRADARPSHERGRSAPPPIGENPWDVNVPQGLVRNSGMSVGTSWVEGMGKPLPPAPSEFRLGEGGEPWSAWDLPLGLDPDRYPNDDNEEPSSTPEPLKRDRSVFATNPAMVSTFSPGPSTTPPPPPPPQPASRIRDVETGRARELGQLSAAMMTVDNGFENQWWYRGPRESVHTDEPRTPESPAAHSLPEVPTFEPLSAEATERVPTGVVSPLTEVPFTPAPTQALQRSMSTRSEELWFTEKSTPR